MKRKIIEKVEIPEGVTGVYEHKILRLSRGSLSLERKINIPETEIKIENNVITFTCHKGNKNSYKFIKTFVAHIHNLFSGLIAPFNYKLEAVNVHFPITLKVDGKKLIINNFLGEKTPRTAVILPNVEVDIKGGVINLKSADKELAGQTAANFEKATNLRGRDRRLFQDGIYITEKPVRGAK